MLWEPRRPLDYDQAALKTLVAAPSVLKLVQMRYLPKLRTAHSLEYPYFAWYCHLQYLEDLNKSRYSLHLCNEDFGLLLLQTANISYASYNAIVCRPHLVFQKRFT